MPYRKHRSRRHRDLRHRWTTYALVLLAALIVVVEGYRYTQFAFDVRTSRAELMAIKDNLDISNLQLSEADVLAQQGRLQDAQKHLASAKSFVTTDPFIFLIGPWPGVGTNAKGVKRLIVAADEAARTGLTASEVELAFTRYQRDPNQTSIQDSLTFLKAQEQGMAAVSAGLDRLKAKRARVPGGLIGPAAGATGDLDTAITKLSGLVQGYNRADTLLPQLLGYNGPRRYLVLPQNDTELFPSGGLISSYGVATFDSGKLTSMDLEYFGTLYDRWQKQTHEYVAPPGPLKNYLKQDYSWSLGEAGWYPDFPKTADLAQYFVSRGGAPATDGVIAIDLQFISALLDLTGPITVPEYNVTITSENASELTLELTRDDAYVPGKPSKTFLSYLSKAVLNRVFTAPKEQWVGMLKLLDDSARERHLQLYFNDPGLEAMSREYGLDGALDPQKTDGDFLMLADTSVNSTKLNMILSTQAQLDLSLSKDGTATTSISYQVQNPFPDWKKGRDPKLVKALMLDGVYGSFLRVYAHTNAVLNDALIDKKSVGTEQDAEELGKHVFGRFFPVLPGGKSTAQFVYHTQGVVQKTGNDTYSYKLYVQKEAGTAGLPLQLQVALPKGAKLDSIRIDGKPQKGQRIATNLLTDRTIEVSFSAP